MIPDVAEFSFMDGVPSVDVEKSPETALERVRLFKELMMKHGGLIPQNVLHDVLKVSRGRIGQFITEGRFETVMFCGQRFVTGPSLEAFLADERKSGRPVKKPGLVTQAKVVVGMAKVVTDWQRK